MQLLIILSLFLILKTECVRQVVVMYFSSDCSGVYQTFPESQGVIDKFPDGGPQSFKISGLWRIVATEWPGLNFTKISKLYEQHDAYSECYSAHAEGFANYAISRVERIGPGTLPWGSPHLTLFTEKELSGMKFDISWTDFKPCLDCGRPPLKIHSVAQFSNEAWILYPNENFTGDPLCLCGIYGYLKENGDKCVDDEKRGREIDDDDYQVYYDIQSVLTVDSVKLDRDGKCDCSVFSTTEPMTTAGKIPCIATSEVSTTVNGPTDDTGMSSQEPVRSTTEVETPESSTYSPETSTTSASDNFKAFSLLFSFCNFILVFSCNLV